MTTDTRMTTSAVDPEVSGSMAVYDRLKPLKDALNLDLNEGEMQLFAMVCYRTGLDPFTRQIYAVRRKGKVVHQTGIDGYRSSAERTREYAGSDEATFEPCDCKQKPEGHPSVARVVVHRRFPDGYTIA